MRASYLEPRGPKARAAAKKRDGKKKVSRYDSRGQTVVSDPVASTDANPAGFQKARAGWSEIPRGTVVQWNNHTLKQDFLRALEQARGSGKFQSNADFIARAATGEALLLVTAFDDVFLADPLPAVASDYFQVYSQTVLQARKLAREMLGPALKAEREEILAAYDEAVARREAEQRVIAKRQQQAEAELLAEIDAKIEAKAAKAEAKAEKAKTEAEKAEAEKGLADRARSAFRDRIGTRKTRNAVKQMLPLFPEVVAQAVADAGWACQNDGAEQEHSYCYLTPLDGSTDLPDDVLDAVEASGWELQPQSTEVWIYLRRAS